jgi:hypothetical protein
MLVRVLIAVLMLAGPNPVRDCTCAAFDRIPDAQTDTTAPAQKPSRCACRTNSSVDLNSKTTESRDRELVDSGHDHSDSDHHQHERDCPAINPEPVVSAFSTPIEDVAIPLDALPFPWIESHDRVTAIIAFQPASRRHVGSVPLYISLLTLRN